MKLIYAYDLLDGVSGEAVFINNLKAAMEKRGVPVKCVSIPHLQPRDLPSSFEFYSRFPMLAKAHLRLRGECKGAIVHFLTSALSPAGRFLKGCKKVASSHFFIDSYQKNAPARSAAARLAEGAYARYVSLLDKPTFRSLDRLVACSDFHSRAISETYGVEKGRMRVIPPGIDVGYFKKLPKTDLRGEFNCEKAVVYAGRLHERSKGVSLLIHAMKGLECPGAKLIIVGDGPDRGGYERMAREYGLESRIVFLGALDFYRKSVIQKSADAIVMPSLYEAFGTVFAESLACGTPVVAFDLPFWKGLYDNAGILVNPREKGALSSGIRLALEGDNRGLISRGMGLAERYDLRKTADSYVSLYEELAACD